MDSLTVITSKKYKTLGELLKSPIKSIILTSNKEKNEDIKSYLYEWLYKNYYSKKIVGNRNLTTIIKNISNKPCYGYIMKECFNNMDVLQFNKTTKQILNDECIQFIKILHSVSSSLTGTLLDYLVRRIICEITQKTFHDNRASRLIDKDNNIIHNLDTEEVWTYIRNDDFGSWKVFKNPSIKSDKIITINQGDNFIVKDKKNEWLNIEYQNYNGWIRYRIPNCVNFSSVVLEDKEQYIINKYIQRVESGTDSHICSHGCMRKFEQNVCYSIPDCLHECKFDKCVNLCYEKITNTEMYSSVDIMEEIFISSLSHSIAFGGCPNQSNVNEILNLIKDTTNIEEIFYLPLRQLCLNLLKGNPNVLLNPALGHDIELLDNINIPADCDLVINNYLYDIKCTSGENSVYEILQLLGYASLLNCISRFNNNKVDNISIINLLQGYIINYDISYITKDQMVNYLRILRGVPYSAS